MKLIESFLSLRVTLTCQAIEPGQDPPSIKETLISRMEEA